MAGKILVAEASNSLDGRLANGATNDVRAYIRDAQSAMAGMTQHQLMQFLGQLRKVEQSAVAPTHKKSLRMVLVAARPVCCLTMQDIDPETEQFCLFDCGMHVAKQSACAAWTRACRRAGHAPTCPICRRYDVFQPPKDRAQLVLVLTIGCSHCESLDAAIGQSDAMAHDVRRLGMKREWVRESDPRSKITSFPHMTHEHPDGSWIVVEPTGVAKMFQGRMEAMTAHA